MQNEQITRLQAEIAELENEIAEANEKMQNLIERIATGESTAVQLKDEWEKLEKQRKSISIFKFAERAQINKETSKAQDRRYEQRKNIENLEEEVNSLESLIENLSENFPVKKKELAEKQEEEKKREADRLKKLEKEQKKEKLEKAANEGDAQAQYELGHWYLKEEQSNWQYESWLKKAANQGHETAQRELCKKYARSYVDRKEFFNALDFFNHAIGCGYKDIKSHFEQWISVVNSDLERHRESYRKIVGDPMLTAIGAVQATQANIAECEFQLNTLRGELARIRD
jgi:TPR repeat protein